MPIVTRRDAAGNGIVSYQRPNLLLTQVRSYNVISWLRPRHHPLFDSEPFNHIQARAALENAARTMKVLPFIETRYRRNFVLTPKHITAILAYIEGGDVAVLANDLPEDLLHWSGLDKGDSR